MKTCIATDKMENKLITVTSPLLPNLADFNEMLQQIWDSKWITNNGSFHKQLEKELGWEPSLQFEEGIEKTVRWYLENQEWMDNVTSGDYQKYYENMYSNR